jgi:Rrf2 family protein
MIRINRQTDYAIRVILYLAQQEENIRIPTAKALREMQVPPSLGQRIVADLARSKFITTYAGRDGGLVLARPAQEINLRQIVEHFEGKFFISDCLVDKGNCPFDNKCPVRFRWVKLQSQIVLELEQITFSELAQDALSASQLFSVDTSETVTP